METHSDVPSRFRAGMRLFAVLPDQARRSLELEDAWPHKGMLVLKFAGIDSISAAEELKGSELQVPAAERAQLDPGWTYISDLVGCAVYDGPRRLGVLADVRFGAGEAPLLVVKADAKEYEIPFAEAYLEVVDTRARLVRMRLPEGMLEINAPMSAEEKREQAASRTRARGPERP